MSVFDSKAREWDNNPMHWERSEAIAKTLLEMIPVKPSMKALDYGAGTGILSFLLASNFSEITLMDNSTEMVNVMREKVIRANLPHFKPLFFDLEHSDYTTNTFDCIYSQMVLHHVDDTNRLLKKFYQMLNPGGYLAIADLYAEDGSFHGAEEKVHHGFDPEVLDTELKAIGFTNSNAKTCYLMKRTTDREYPIFLLTSCK
jgi:tRNA (cmo5U34)-methyltransferase